MDDISKLSTIPPPDAPGAAAPFSAIPQPDAPGHAAPSVSIANEHSLESRMERLVDALLEGRVIPFLGAGISQQAKQKSEGSESKLSLNANVLANRLAQELRDKLINHVSEPTTALAKLAQLALKTAGHGNHGNGIPDWGCLNKSSLGPELSQKFGRPPQSVIIESTDLKLSKPIELWPVTPPLGEVAELCWSILGPAKTCKELALKEWNTFQPTEAHHFLAVLVREGLITEILETNYDELVEDAVEETFGEKDSRPRKPVAVIQDLHSYRDQIAKPRRPAKHEALVKLIKLNGCAGHYRKEMAKNPSDSRKEELARRIILTEEQLQSWGDKVWARELLSDRVRSRSLLFIGFGNQDPIVRHHAIAVIREFGAYAEIDRSPETDWYKLPNAPFVAAYDPNLTFYQHQLLRAFRDAHIPQDRCYDTANLGRLAETYHNTFHADHVPSLDPKHPVGTLPADLLLWRVTGQALCRHIPTEYLRRGSAVERHLHGALRDPKALLMTVKRLVFAGTVKSPAPFEQWMALKAGTTGDQQSSAWASVCFAILGKSPGRGGYVPFSDEPIRLPMLLALLVIASPPATDPASLPDADQLRLRCRATGGGDKFINGFCLLDRERNGRRWPVYAAQNVDRFLRDWGTVSRGPAGPPPALDQAVVVLLGRGLLRAFRKHCWVSPDDPTDVRVLREVIVMGDLTALRGHSREPVHLPTAAKNLESVAHIPERMLDLRERWRDYCIEE